MITITKIENNSIAKRIGLKVNDVIASFDGEECVDMLDVAYYDSQSSFSLTVLRNGKSIAFSVEKSANEPMGWDFDADSYITPRWCANKCLFCFVDQLPKGQRKTLYVKDDDWRLSFVSGNYVTLTNVTEKELQRIKQKKFSPLYVSVHATNDDVRKKLLGNNNAQPILPLLKQLADAGITMYTQVVLCPGINDGKVLIDTVTQLMDLYPAVKSLAIVPVGLTKHRCNLCNISPVTATNANEIIDHVEYLDEQFFAKNGCHFAYCSDEMYVIANRDCPSCDYYGDFEQLENGVGLIADFNYQFDLALQDAVKAKSNSFTIVTGVSATPIIQSALSRAKEKYPKLQANVVTVVNNFFGDTVTVAGLVVGKDIVDTLSSTTNAGDTLLLPRVMLKEDQDVFLDGMTLQQLKKQTKKKIQIIADGYELCQAILECK